MHARRQKTTRSSATAKSTARPSCVVGVLYDISRERYCWLINHFYVMGCESYRIRWNNAHNGHYAVQDHFKVTDFGTNRIIRLPILVINSNLPPILHRLQVMADYWSHLRCFTLTPSLRWSVTNIRINLTYPETRSKTANITKDDITLQHIANVTYVLLWYMPF